MTALLFTLGVVVLAEALNKLERTRPCWPGLSRRMRLLQWLKALAWALLAIAAGGAIIGPIFGAAPPTPREVCIGQGFRGKAGDVGVGACTAGFAHSVGGCPPRAADVLAFLRGLR